MIKRVKLLGIREPVTVTDYVADSDIDKVVEIDKQMSLGKCLDMISEKCERKTIVLADCYTCVVKFVGAQEYTVRVDVDKFNQTLTKQHYVAAILSVFMTFMSNNKSSAASKYYTDLCSALNI